MAKPAALELSTNRARRVIPGFGLTLGYTMVYLSLLVLIPLSAVFIRSLGLGWGHFWEVVTAPRVIASLRLSFGASLIAALINVIFGLIVAWVLVRYSFPFRRLVDAIVDLPFALPTAVAGIALTALYAPNGWLGFWLAKAGITVAFTPLGDRGGADFHRPAVRGAHPAAGARGFGQGSGAGRGDARRLARCRLSHASYCRRFGRPCSPASRWPSPAPSVNTVR